MLLTLALVQAASLGQQTAQYCKDKQQCTGTDILCKACGNPKADGSWPADPDPKQQKKFLGGKDCDMTGTTQSTKVCKKDGTTTKCKELRDCTWGNPQDSAICPTAANACEVGHPGKKCRHVLIGVATHDPTTPLDNKTCQDP